MRILRYLHGPTAFVGFGLADYAYRRHQNPDASPWVTAARAGGAAFFWEAMGPWAWAAAGAAFAPQFAQATSQIVRGAQYARTQRLFRPNLGSPDFAATPEGQAQGAYGLQQMTAARRRVRPGLGDEALFFHQ